MTHPGCPRYPFLRAPSAGCEWHDSWVCCPFLFGTDDNMDTDTVAVHADPSDQVISHLYGVLVPALLATVNITQARVVCLMTQVDELPTEDEAECVGESCGGVIGSHAVRHRSGSNPVRVSLSSSPTSLPSHAPVAHCQNEQRGGE
ncbi:hypothetical protein BaRGS_00014751 [Batillaria attramentaria]|uniref:Uncharacterized protein n=1 Tax=Batillaria attramentaria TaxID=370345 RepID=A0ABD0L421_9CAEN